MNKKEANFVKRSVGFTPDMLEQLDKLAASKHIPTAELIRQFVDKGLGITSYESQIDFIRKQIREELQIQLKPTTDRIMKMLMRIGMMAVTFSYFTSKIIYYFVPFSEQKSHDELMNEARKNAAAYLSVRDETLDKAYKDYSSSN